MLRGLWAVLLLAMWLGLQGEAQAAGEEDRCAAVWGLSGLAPEELGRLYEMCARRTKPEPSHLPVLSAVATRATWESATLGTILAGGAPHLDLGASKDHAGAAQRLRALRRGLHAGLVEHHAAAATGGRCGWVREGFDAYVADLAAREVPLPPIAGYALIDDQCLALDPAWLGDVHFLTIAADAATAMTVTASAADRLVVQWLDAKEAVVHQGRRIFVVAVPRWSVVTVEAQQQGGTAAVWHGLVTSDQTVWDRSPGAGCLRVSIDLDPDTTLLLDGRAVTRGQSLAHRAVGVLEGRHELVALRCSPAAEGRSRCAVQFREALAEGGRGGVRNLCQEIKIDLHQRSSVALLGAEAAPGCDAGLAFQVGAQAAERLQATQAETGRVFRDLKAVASATDALASLRSSLNPAAGQAVGATTGADSMDQLGSVAKEAWRQGIDSLLTFELRCEASGAGAGYRVVGSKLAVREILGRQRGEVAGLDLQQMIVVESVHVRQPAHIASAVASVIDRLFAQDYIRILGSGTKHLHHKSAPVDVVMFHRHAATDPLLREEPKVEAIHVADQGRPAPEICGQLGRAERGSAARAAAEAFLAGKKRGGARVEVTRVDAGEDEANARSASYLASVRAAWPGTYLVAVWWQGGGKLADAVCLRFDVQRSEVWASFGFATDVSAWAGVREYQWLYLRALVGRTWYVPYPWLGFGLLAGYTFGRYISHDGQPAWQDLTVHPAGSGALFSWSRHGVIAGPLIEVRSRKATWPIELRARAAVAGGLAIVDVSRLPPQFVDFVTRDPLDNPDIRIRPTIDAMFDVGASYQAGPVTLGHSLFFGMNAINDMVKLDSATTAINGSGLVLGLSVTVGGGI